MSLPMVSRSTGGRGASCGRGAARGAVEPGATLLGEGGRSSATGEHSISRLRYGGTVGNPMVLRRCASALGLPAADARGGQGIAPLDRLREPLACVLDEALSLLACSKSLFRELLGLLHDEVRAQKLRMFARAALGA